MSVGSDVDLALLFRESSDLSNCKKQLYRRPRPDTWPQDLAFFLLTDFYERSLVGGLPMVIRQDGKRIYPEETA